MTEATFAPIELAAAGRRPGRRRDLVVHLVRRELGAAHRFSVLGAAWPLARLLVQWGVLAFVFTSLVDLGIHDYPAFLLAGLVAWTWLGTGIAAGASSIVQRRALVFQPGVPAVVLPAVAVGAATVDALIALPVLLAVVAATGGLGAPVLLMPALLIAQLTIMAGVSWLLAAVCAYLRDVRSLVDVGLALLFYLTPVFYAREQVPSGLRAVVDYNPAGALVQSWRALVVDGELPAARPLLVIAVTAVVAVGSGLWAFRRLEPGFVDHV